MSRIDGDDVGAILAVERREAAGDVEPLAVQLELRDAAARAPWQPRAQRTCLRVGSDEVPALLPSHTAEAPAHPQRPGRAVERERIDAALDVHPEGRVDGPVGQQVHDGEAIVALHAREAPADVPAAGSVGLERRQGRHEPVDVLVGGKTAEGALDRAVGGREQHHRPRRGPISVKLPPTYAVVPSVTISDTLPSTTGNGSGTEEGVTCNIAIT